MSVHRSSGSTQHIFDLLTNRIGMLEARYGIVDGPCWRHDRELDGLYMASEAFREIMRSREHRSGPFRELRHRLASPETTETERRALVAELEHVESAHEAQAAMRHDPGPTVAVLARTTAPEHRSRAWYTRKISGLLIEALGRLQARPHTVVWRLADAAALVRDLLERHPDLKPYPLGGLDDPTGLGVVCPTMRPETPLWP